MILQELNQYYSRKLAENSSDIPPYGTSVESISFALILGKDGRLQGIDDLREQEGKKLLPRKISVPAAVTRTSGIKANFLWDKTSYVLGADSDGCEAHRPRFVSFRELFLEIAGDIEDEGLQAVSRFLGSWNCFEAERAISVYYPWEEVASSNVVFRLDGTPGFVHNRPLIQKAWLEHSATVKDTTIVRHCLISGAQDEPLARVHSPIKGVQGGQTSGGYIVSYNAAAFVSYGKDKAEIADNAAFTYTTALNYLLRRNSRQKIVIGDTTVTFWAQQQSPAEDFFVDLFSPTTETKKESKSEDDQGTADKVHDFLQALRDGRRTADIAPDLDDSVRFFILGLAPNAARLSIRFWLVNDLGVFLERIGTHFQQLAITRQFDSEPEFPPLWRLLCHTASQGKSENVSPVLAGSMIKAVLGGGRYSNSLLSTVLSRIRAEQQLGYFRAALLKALLIRNYQMEVPMSLDVNRQDVPYLLGRLFAILEKAQSDAVPGANATMKDRYFASAPATPARIFPMLLKNTANHTAKLRKDSEKTGWAVAIEKNIRDIVDNLPAFPATLLAEEQGLFMIGYYHQMKDLYTKKISTNDTNKEN